MQELAVRDAAHRMGTPLAWYLDDFPEIALAKNLNHPSAQPGFPLGGDLNPSPPPSPAPEIPIDDEDYNAEYEDIWAGDEGYDVWGNKRPEDSSDSESVKSVINIVESPEVIMLSSDESEGSHNQGSIEESTWSSGSKTNNSSDLDYKPRKGQGGNK